MNVMKIKENKNASCWQKFQLKLEEKLDDLQKEELKKGIDRGIDVSLYNDYRFSWDQMAKIREGLEAKLDVRVLADFRFDSFQMAIILEGLKKGLDVRVYAKPELSPIDMEREMLKLIEEKICKEKYRYINEENKYGETIDDNFKIHKLKKTNKLVFALKLFFIFPIMFAVLEFLFEEFYISISITAGVLVFYIIQLFLNHRKFTKGLKVINEQTDDYKLECVSFLEFKRKWKKSYYEVLFIIFLIPVLVKVMIPKIYLEFLDSWGIYTLLIMIGLNLLVTLRVEQIYRKEKLGYGVEEKHKNGKLGLENEKKKRKLYKYSDFTILTMLGFILAFLYYIFLNDITVVRVY